MNDPTIDAGSSFKPIEELTEQLRLADATLQKVSIPDLSGWIPQPEYFRFREIVKSIQAHSDATRIVNWSLFSRTDIDNAQSMIASATNLIEDIARLARGGRASEETRQEIRSQLRALDRLLGTLAGSAALGMSLTIAATKGPDWFSSKISAALSEIYAESAMFQRKLSEEKQEAEKVLKDFDARIKHGGLAAHARSFDRHARWQMFYCIACLAAAGAAARYASEVGYAMFQHSVGQVATNASAGYYTQLALTKTAIVAIPVAIAIVFAKAFRACLHNYVVNKHRANAIRAYLWFARTTSSTAVKDTALLHVASAIFSHQSSGFADGDADSDPILKLYEKIKDASPAAK